MSKAPAAVLVEGPDDYHVVHHLLLKNGFRVVDAASKNITSYSEAASKARLLTSAQGTIFEIVICDGKDELFAQIPVLAKDPELHSLGILTDADTNVLNSYARIQGRLQRLQYPCPQNPGIEGTIIQTENAPVVGIWIMPDCQSPGAMEDFFFTLIPNDDPLWPFARNSVDSLPKRNFLPHHTNKAYAHTWLAWQEKPGTRMGSAISQNYVLSTSPTAGSFVQWLDRLLHNP